MLEKQLKTENLVSERIRKYVQAKTDQLNSKADDQEEVKVKRVDVLEKEKDDINRKKDEDDKEIARMHTLI